MLQDNNIHGERKVAPATSGNNLNEREIRITTVEVLKAEGMEIVYLAFNRNVTDNTPHVKALAKSIKEEGLHTPLHLVPATTAIAEGIELLDDNGSAVTDGENKLVLVNGNNKFRATLVLRASNDPGKAIEPIKCIVDEGARNIQRMTMNNVVKPWSNADAIKAASNTKPNEEVKFIEHLAKVGFTFSTISLILTGQNNKIKKDVIMKYIAGTGELPKCDIEKAKKKLNAMKEAGFSTKFIKSRYLIEAINSMMFQGYNLGDVLEALKKFTPKYNLQKTVETCRCWKTS